MKKNLYHGNKNARKPESKKQSKQVLFRVTTAEHEKLGAEPNKKAKSIVLSKINE